MTKTSDPKPPISEQPVETPENQIARLKSEIGQALQPIRKAVDAGDFNEVKKLYRSLIRTYHEDKFRDAVVKRAVSGLNKAINLIDTALKSEAPDERRIQLLRSALADIERSLGTTENRDQAGAEEVTEADIETEGSLMSQEIESLGQECRATYDAMQAAQRRVYDLQMMQSSLVGLSEEFRNAHQNEIQRIWASAAELQARLTALDARFTAAQTQVSFFRYYQQEKAALAGAPRHMHEMARQADAIRERLLAVQTEFDRENRTAETLNRQMEKFQAEYLQLQTERAKVAQWQAFLDQQLFNHPPFTQAFEVNRQQRRALDAQDSQLVGRMQELAATIQSLNEQRLQNTQLRQRLWQDKLQLEAQGNRIYQDQARAYEDISRRQAALTAARVNIAQTVRQRKNSRPRPAERAEA